MSSIQTSLLTPLENDDALQDMANHPELRNFAPRTYSGADLIHKLNERTLTFPNLSEELGNKSIPRSHLDDATELKLMDIIMGDDMLGEGVKKNDQDKKNLKQDIKSALKISGSKRAMLQSRYDVIMTAFYNNLKNSGATCNEKSKNALLNFKLSWSDASQGDLFLFRNQSIE